MRLPDLSRLPRPPRRPIRTLVRLVGRAAVAAVAVWLDLGRHEPAQRRSRRAREVRRGDPRP